MRVDRGVPSGGKKNEQVDLVEKALEAYEEIQPCDHKESERKRRTMVDDDDGTVLVNLNGKEITWTSDLKAIPRLSTGDVFAYLVDHCEWTTERLAKHKSDYLIYKDGHVEDVKMGNIIQYAGHSYIKAMVKPEQRQTAQRYST